MKSNHLVSSCSACGSSLIVISQEIVKLEGSRYTQTNTEYKCSNEECQKVKDKEKEKRVLLSQKKEVSDKERQVLLQEKKLLRQVLKEEGKK